MSDEPTWDLLDSAITLNGVVDDALYIAKRYEDCGYNHQRAKYLNTVAEIQEICEEIQEEYDD